MKRVQIFPIVQTIPNNDPYFNITFPLKDGTTAVILTPDMVKGYFINFADWYILKPDNDERTDFEYFREIWKTYGDISAQSWKMLFTALYSEYEPINNYDITEESGGDFTHTPDGVSDTVVTKVEAGTGAKQPKSSHYVATYESAEKPVEYTTTAGESTNTQTITARATYTDEHSDTLHRYGNAGTMTTAEVIRQEALLRKSELAAEIVLGGFIEKFCFYSGAVIV